MANQFALPAESAPDSVDKARTALSLTNPARRKRAFFAFLDSMTAAQAPGVERLIFELNRKGIDLPEKWLNAIGSPEIKEDVQAQLHRSENSESN